MNDEDLRKLLRPAEKRKPHPQDEGWDAFRAAEGDPDKKVSPYEPGTYADEEWRKGWDLHEEDLNN